LVTANPTNASLTGRLFDQQQFAFQLRQPTRGRVVAASVLSGNHHQYSTCTPKFEPCCALPKAPLPDQPR